MYNKCAVTLVYMGQGVLENGSPYHIEIKKKVRCDEMESFSSSYYNERERELRFSKNLIVPSYLCQNQSQDGVTCRLMDCIFDGRTYQIKSILKLKGTRQRMILDIQEVQ